MNKDLIDRVYEYYDGCKKEYDKVLDEFNRTIRAVKMKCFIDYLNCVDTFDSVHAEEFLIDFVDNNFSSLYTDYINNDEVHFLKDML